MLEPVVLAINGWMGGSLFWAALGCFLWGVVSILFSPCHLASIPLIVGYVGGQNRLLTGRQAVRYAVLFSMGLFLTVAAVGVFCSLLGRMLGDVGPWWTILVGGVLIWVALDMLGIVKGSFHGGFMQRMRLRGSIGAFVLGLAYGVLSGMCTFGFIAPILAVITVQQRIADGILLILLFGLGHCIPIAVAGSSAATARRLLESSSMQEGSRWFRRGAGALIGGLGVYFLVQSFLGTV